MAYPESHLWTIAWLQLLPVVAVGDMIDLPVQEDEYDTDSESDVDDDTPSDIPVSRSGRAISTHFRLDW